MPRDVTIQLRLDRYLLPATAVRQAVLLYAGDPDNFIFLEPEYDMLERVLLYRLGGDAVLAPDLLYTFRIRAPIEADEEGLRAFDGAPLEAGPVPLEFHFRTASVEPTCQQSGRVEPETPPTCGVAWIFEQGGCGRSTCHGDDQRMGLRLATGEGLFLTAINRVAHQTAIGPGSRPLEEPPRLGVQMPIIDPGRPDNSYMMYKLIRRPQNFGGICESRYAVSLAGQCLEPPAEESVRLREWFVRGNPMPLAEPRPDFSYDDLRGLQRWIAGGAPLEALPACSFAPRPVNLQGECPVSR